MEAELNMLTSVRMTLEGTKQYLANASKDERETIGRVLWYFNFEHGPGGPGMRPGGPPADVDVDVDGVVRRMIEHTENEIEHINAEVQEMR
jgi:hypothetical protein